ncbi:protein of unknown function [Paraburkholderia kururiensis]
MRPTDSERLLVNGLRPPVFIKHRFPYHFTSLYQPLQGQSNHAMRRSAPGVRHHDIPRSSGPGQPKVQPDRAKAWKKCLRVTLIAKAAHQAFSLRVSQCLFPARLFTHAAASTKTCFT